MYYIYVIQNKLDLMVYVGQTVNPKTRWSQHKWLSKNNPIQYIHRAMVKHGSDNFIFQIIDQTNDGYFINDLEVDWINYFKSRDSQFGYNLAPGGDSSWNRGLPANQQPMYGKHHSEESKRKISESNMGKIMPLHTDEWKKKISQTNMGHFTSKETKQKISNSLKNRKLSSIHIENIKESLTGRILSKETKQKMSKSQKFLLENKRAVKLNWKLVELIREQYACGEKTKNIAKKYGVSVMTIHRVIKNKSWKL